MGLIAMIFSVGGGLIIGSGLVGLSALVVSLLIKAAIRNSNFLRWFVVSLLALSPSLFSRKGCSRISSNGIRDRSDRAISLPRLAPVASAAG